MEYYVKLIIENDVGCIDTSACLSIFDVGFDSNTLEFEVYPNPTNGLFTIKTHNSTPVQLTIYNVLGEEV